MSLFLHPSPLSFSFQASKQKGKKTLTRQKSHGAFRVISPDEINRCDADSDYESNTRPHSIEISERRCHGDQEATSSSGRERKSRRDGAMNTRGYAPVEGRGRTPSPKRLFAPKPPSSRDCPSPLPKMVSTVDLHPVDQQGWLIDQLRGRKVWCAISDMLFCVFEKEDSKVSKQIIVLPGCQVRAIEFKSASQDGKVLNEVARRFASKTISGVDKYQFLIENSSNRQKFMFGVASKQELDAWMTVLGRACCIDVGSAAADAEESILGQNESDFSTDIKSPQNSVRSTTSSYSTAQTLPSRLDVLSLTLPLTNTHEGSLHHVDEIRKRIRKDTSGSDSPRPSPMRVSRDFDGDKRQVSGNYEKEPTIVNGKGEHRKSSWHLRLRSPLDLIRRKKRSSSADDAHNRNRKLFPVMDPDTISNPSLSPRLSDSQPSLASSIKSGASTISNDTSTFSSGSDSKTCSEKKGGKNKRSFLSRSWDPDKKSRGFAGSSIRKSASDFKEKIFGSSSSGGHPNSDKKGEGKSKTRSAGIKVKDLHGSRQSGALQYRLGTKWIKVWCVLSRGCLYAFKGNKADESPILVVVLNQCSVTYTTAVEDEGKISRSSKRMFVFKITQEHCKSIYMSTDSIETLLVWMNILQTEGVQVEVSYFPLL